MVCSNEPGYYEDGGFGIRVENLLTVEEAGTEFRWGCVCVDQEQLVVVLGFGWDGVCI